MSTKWGAAAVFSFISFSVGTVLGSGALWQWQQHKLDVQKQELDRVVQTTELRKQENDQYIAILELTGMYVDKIGEYSKRASPELNNEIVRMKAQLDLMKDNFTHLESKLAQVEGRQPRSIPIDFIPPAAPTGLTVVVR